MTGDPAEQEVGYELACSVDVVVGGPGLDQWCEVGSKGLARGGWTKILAQTAAQRILSTWKR